MAAQLAPAEVDVVMERALAELPVESWQVVDTRRMGGRGPRVDMVLVGPPGVFVVGCATVKDSERSRAKAAMALATAAEDVAALVGVRRDEVYPVLCLAGDAVADGWSRGVTTCAPSNLVETIVFRRSLFTPDEVQRVAVEISRSVRGGSGKHRA
jgi:hypothetical protein